MKTVKRKPATPKLSPQDLLDVERYVRQGLAVALYMSESEAEEHAAHAAETIAESLHNARLILEGKGGAA